MQAPGLTIPPHPGCRPCGQREGVPAHACEDIVPAHEAKKQPVWLVDDGEAWWFIAAPNRMAARRYVAGYYIMPMREAIYMRVREEDSCYRLIMPQR